jgi:hypothetical protein
MLSLKTHKWTILAAFAVLVPSPAPAQSVANTFEELGQVLKKGQTIVVTDASGQRTKGKVSDLSPSSLVIVIPDARTFAEGSVAEIRRTDSVRNGALIGAGVGVGLSIWDYAIDPSEPGNAAYTAVFVTLGTAIGAGIDALVNKGGKVVYRSRPQPRSLTISPLARKGRQGVLLSLRF